ncbi:hypothetical protein MQX03_00100 [Chryseobacterium aahli]|uniref:hypothetical protein n=1 Tax=Chryseobacterium aahli TaxID=1278643 RepID=UPI001F60C268|nr:hypothetical protein [Chryseobacterium aahli]MCI3935583.1 hypothetical protein [Chryseobacterium aahli]
MKAAKPVEKDNKSHQNQSKKQKAKKPMVVPLPMVEATNIQKQKPEESVVNAGFANTNVNRMSLNGTIPPVHGSQNVYDQGSEITYEKLQESLAQTGDINHPDTKEIEKDYMSTLNIDQARDYNDLKSGTYLPKTTQEQAAAHQEDKNSKAVIPKEKSNDKGNANVSLAGLSATPATQLVSNFNAVQNNSTAFLNSQTEKATGKLPKVNAKIGSAFSGSKPKGKSNGDKTVAKSSKKTVKSVGQKQKPKEISFPQNEPLKKVNYSFNTAGNKNGGLEKQAKLQFNKVQLSTSAIPTTMQQNAHVDISGEADTEHLAIEQHDVAQDMSIKKNQAAKEIHKDYGENSIIKKPNDEVLKPSRKINSKAVKKQPIDVLKLEGIDEANINAQFEPIIQSKIGAENEKYQAAELEHDQKVLEHEKSAETQIGAEKDKSHQSQLKSVKDAQADVHNSRVEWQGALNKTESDFAKKSSNQAKTTLGNIKTEKSRGETQAQKHITKANEDALKEKNAANKQAIDKKSEMDKKSGGFFGWVADKVSQFIDALKDALNVIFTALRKAVKAIFDAAKKLVLEALEAARKLIVGFIKGFASLLKGFLDFALAAFPGIRDRLKAKIDKYVAAAEKFVNQTFEVFKKAVVAIIDFLAETVDKLLGVIQSVYEGILTVVGMIVSGDIIELLRKLGNIKDALFAITFDTIKQGGMEELLGVNLDESLSPEELMAAMQMGLLSGGNEQDSDDGMPKAPWTNANVGVDVVSFEELSPEMQAELRRMQKAGQTEATLGERNDPSRTMSSVMEEAKTPQSAPETSGQKFNDGLTPMKRAEIKWEMMKTGIKQWWDDNWLKVVGGIIAGLVIFIAAEVVTGGAITAALPVIMPILADVFIGVAIAQIAPYFVDGLAKSWDGDIKGGTKAFSRGLGASLIELAMYLGFKLVEVAAKAITNLVKAGLKLAKSSAKAVMNYAKFIIKEGKVLFKGIAGKNLGKLSKTLRKLGDDILERMRIKKVLLKIQGKRWEILAEINPLFVIMSGPMPDEDVMSIIKKDKADVPKGLKKGDIYFDEQGRELMKISRLDKFTKTPDYREIFALANRADISNDVIHHLIEKGSDFAYLFEKELINAPKSLRAIPKGNINEILHLSDIRVAWDDMYKLCNQLLKEGGTTSDVRSLIKQFAGKTDDFISKSLSKIAQQEKLLGPLSKEQISNITNEFKYLLK